MTNQSVFIVGDFTVDRLGASYRRGFEAIGFIVDGFDMSHADEYLTWPARQRVLHRLTSHHLSARRYSSRLLNAEVLRLIRSSPSRWVLLLSGEWIMPETIRAMQSLGKRVAIFHPDNPFPPHYNSRAETMDAAREADLYLIWSDRLVSQLRRDGIRNPTFLPFGWDPEVFPHQDAIEQGTWPGVVFVGGWDPPREAFLNEIAAHVPLHIYGPGYWGTRTRLRSPSRWCWQGKALSMADAAATVRSAAICLNVLRDQHMVDGVPDGTIMRHFEIPGAGGFLLSTRSESATRLLPEGDVAAYFADPRECVEACRHYLNAHDERRQLAARSHALVASEHRYSNRASEIVQLMTKLESMA